MFFSGPVIQREGEPQPVWFLKVEDTEPMFFYRYANISRFIVQPDSSEISSAPGDCTDWAMVGVINPVSAPNKWELRL